MIYASNKSPTESILNRSEQFLSNILSALLKLKVMSAQLLDWSLNCSLLQFFFTLNSCEKVLAINSNEEVGRAWNKVAIRAIRCSSVPCQWFSLKLSATYHQCYDKFTAASLVTLIENPLSVKFHRDENINVCIACSEQMTCVLSIRNVQHL